VKAREERSGHTVPIPSFHTEFEKDAPVVGFVDTYVLLHLAQDGVQVGLLGVVNEGNDKEEESCQGEGTREGYREVPPAEQHQLCV
jgi:hypothetical protein